MWTSMPLEIVVHLHSEVMETCVTSLRRINRCSARVDENHWKGPSWHMENHLDLLYHRQWSPCQVAEEYLQFLWGQVADVLLQEHKYSCLWRGKCHVINLKHGKYARSGKFHLLIKASDILLAAVTPQFCVSPFTHPTCDFVKGDGWFNN